MHSLAIVLIPMRHDAKAQSTVAREAAARAKLEILMLRHEQPEEQSWGVDTDHGFTCDWWEVGGRWRGWGRRARTLMKKQHVPASRVPIPRNLEPNAAWSEDLARLRLSTWPPWPLAIVTPYGDWVEAPTILFSAVGKLTTRERKAKSAWLWRIRTLMQDCPGCLAIAVDYHW